MKKLITGISALALFLAFTPVASANSSYFSPSASTAAATSTVTYMTPGNATTTVTYDSYNLNGTNQSGTVNSFAADHALALVQFAASSTTSNLLINEEYSPDNVDWYQGSQTLIDKNATTTTTVSLSPVPQYSYLFASSTPGLGAITAANSATSTLAISIPTPTRYIRLVFSLKLGGGNGALWATVLPKKQTP